MLLGLLGVLSCSGDEYVEPDAALEVEGIYRGLYSETGKNLVIGADVEIKRLDKNKISITRANADNTFTPDIQIEIRRLSNSVYGEDNSYIASFDVTSTKTFSYNNKDENTKKIFYGGVRLSDAPDYTVEIIGDYEGTFIKGTSIEPDVKVKVTKISNTEVKVSPVGKAFPVSFDVALYKISKDQIFTFNQLRESLSSSKNVSITFDLDSKKLYFTNYKAGGEGFNGTKK
ncbi:MAG: hypothetical protein OHK0038_02000 [Flammeovirgaceae bacterium]